MMEILEHTFHAGDRYSRQKIANKKLTKWRLGNRDVTDL